MKATAALMHDALADCDATSDLIVDGDRVAVRYTTRARHAGSCSAPPERPDHHVTGIELSAYATARSSSTGARRTYRICSSPPPPTV